MKRAQHPQNGCKGQPWADDDGSGRVACLYCPHIYVQGNWSRYGRADQQVHGRPHDLVVLVPEPVAALDDDEFATAGGLA